MKYLTKSYRPVGLLNEMDRMFEGFVDAPARAARPFPVNIAETGDAYMVEADLPGFTKDEVDVRVEENLLIVEARAQKEAEKTSDSKGEKEPEVRWLVRETRRTAMKRSFVIPEDVDRNAFEAVMVNGRLNLTLKKRAETKPRSIEIKG